MSKVIINFKIDIEIKKRVQSLAREMGIPLSVIVNAQLRELLRSRTLNVSTEPRMTPYLERIIMNVEQERNAITKTNSISDAIAHLDTL